MKSVSPTLIALALLTLSAGAKENYAAQSGLASWYGSENARASSGEKYCPTALTAAHRTLPFGSLVKVINVENSKSVVVRVNDRGPFCKKRVIDVSKAAARELQMIQAGTARVRVELIAQN